MYVQLSLDASQCCETLKRALSYAIQLLKEASAFNLLSKAVRKVGEKKPLLWERENCKMLQPTCCRGKWAMLGKLLGQCHGSAMLQECLAAPLWKERPRTRWLQVIKRPGRETDHLRPITASLGRWHLSEGMNRLLNKSGITTHCCSYGNFSWHRTKTSNDKTKPHKQGSVLLYNNYSRFSK